MSLKLSLDIVKQRCGGNLTTAENLSLQGLGLTSLDASILNSMPNLQVLDVSNNRFRDIPSGLCLPKLKKLDCSDNQLNDVLFLSQLPSLQELHIIGNGLQASYRYIAFTLCPQLKQIDSKKTASMEKIALGMTQSLNVIIKDIWEEKFVEDFDNGEYGQDDLDDVCRSVAEKVGRKQGSFRTALLAIFGKFLVKHLSRQFVEAKFESVDEATRPPPKKRARCSSHSKSSSPTKLMKSPTKSMKSPAKSMKSPAKSMKSPAKSIKTPSKSIILPTKSSRKFTSIIPVKESDEFTEDSCPMVFDYDPIHFVRCHFGDKAAVEAGHKGQDPSDGVTEVWACQFEPCLDDSGKTKPRVATCGGEHVCLLDCSSGHVLQRFHQPQMAYHCLAWTTLSTEHDDKTIRQNVLAVAGKRGRVELFLPIQHLWYGSFGTDRPNQVMGNQEYAINSVCFHRTQPQWLFAGGSDGAIELWDIGVPQGESMKADSMKLAVFRSSAPQIVCILWSDTLSQLIAGSDLGLFCWKVEKSFANDKVTKTRHPDSQLCLPGVHKDAYVDALVALEDNLIACKVVGEGCIMVFNLKTTLAKDRKKKEKNVEVLLTLDWKKCEADFIQMGSVGQKLVVGDDAGNLFIYNLRFLQTKKTASHQLRPSRILEWPECDTESQREAEKLMTDLKKISKKSSLVINSCNMGSDEEFLVATTSNNVVCIWKRKEEFLIL